MTNTTSEIQPAILPEQITTLAKAGVIPADTPPAILDVFAHACKEHGLSPFKKEIYLVKYSSKQGAQYHTIVGIDGFRIRAARTGQFAGIDDPKYNLQSSGQYQTAAQVKTSGKLPISCTVTVYRVIAGNRCPFTATCVFDEYYPAVAAGRSEFSKAATMPFNMIAKCAEAKALKMGFSDQLASLHIEEEAAAFTDTTIEAARRNPSAAVDLDKLKKDLFDCGTAAEVKALYAKNPEGYREFAEMFTDRAYELEPELMLKKKGE